MKTKLKIILPILVIFVISTESQAMRWYSANTGRWLSRDPIDEAGFNPVAFNQKSLHAASVEQLLRQLSHTTVRFRRSDFNLLVDIIADVNNTHSVGKVN